MTKRMLVDATHPEETRVVVVSGNRLEELDFEIASRKQLKGNIYLAKVTRVEPSLQAAFVEYGGNRHGFLAFAEIHPDYYRIPVADREALIEEEERLQAAEERRQEELAERRGRRDRPSRGEPAMAEAFVPEELHDTGSPMPEPLELDGGEDAGFALGEVVSEVDQYPGHGAPSAGETDDTAQVTAADAVGESDGGSAVDAAAEAAAEADASAAETVAAAPASEAPAFDTAPHDTDLAPVADRCAPAADDVPDDVVETDFAGSDPDGELGVGDDSADLLGHADTAPESRTESETGDIANGDAITNGDAYGHEKGNGREAAADAGESFDTVGGDEIEDVQRRRPRPLRSYKIQEVIKRRQIMLVQVTKEERGNKGAALTTYLSLPGRYCVLMPNTGRGGGISRKITNPADRKRLKDILGDLDIPRGMAVILRTAGLERSKPEIKRDLEYLLRLWDDIREQTLQSTAPALIYEEANLIKRAIRDVYSSEIDEIWVEGEQGFNTARDFMRMLMPGHTGRVQRYTDDSIPLFHRYQVETQIDAIHSPIVQLRSGGYIVINPTEALVAIDVNSGKSTRERNIEETAFKTNLEAAEEVARQLRLRDLAGLIVIDFIDMEDPRNNATVERRLKEAMKNDRARIQLGRISPFGLLELSRQRLRPSLLETNFERCPHCAGTGVVRSVESASLHVLRAIEEEGIRKRSSEITVSVPTQIALYILNQKRGDLARIEERYGFRVMIQADDTLIAPDLRLERIKAKLPDEDGAAPVSAERILAETDRALAAEEVEEDEEEIAEAEGTEAAAPRDARPGEAGENGDRRRRRRRRRRGRPDQRDGTLRPDGESEAPGEAEEFAADGTDDGGDESEGAEDEGAEESGAEETGADDAGEESEGEAAGSVAGESEAERRRRRRGKRGGRRRTRGRDGEELGDSAAPAEATGTEETAPRQPVVRAVLPPPGELKPLESIDFDWILTGEEAPAEAPPTEEVAAAAPATPAEAAPVEAIAVEAPATEAPAVVAPEGEAPASETAAAEAAPAEELPGDATPAEGAAKPRKRSTAPRSRKKKAAEPIDAAPEAAPAVDMPAPEAPATAPETAAVETTPMESGEPAAEAPTAAKPRKRSTAPRSRKKKGTEPIDAAAAPLPDSTSLAGTEGLQPGGPPEPVDLGLPGAVADWPTTVGPDADPTPEELAFAQHMLAVQDEEAAGDKPAEAPAAETARAEPPATGPEGEAGDQAPEKPRRGWWNRLVR